MPPTHRPVAAHVQAALAAGQAKKADPTQGRPMAAHVQAAITLGPGVGQARYIQRSATSSAVPEPERFPLHKAMQSYTAVTGGMRILVIDNGRGRISAYSTDRGSREIGYLTYERETTEYGVGVYEFGYILVQSSAQGKKISSLLMMHLALKALGENVPIVRVIKPDPTLANYWQHVGFDFADAKQKQASLYNAPLSEIQAVPFAEGVAGHVFRQNATIASSYWKM